MLSAYQRELVQKVMVLFGLALAFFYLLVYRAVSRNAENLDKPLIDAWQRLAKTNVQPRSVMRLDLRTIREDVQQVQASVQMIENAGKIVSATIALHPPIAAKMAAPFQLVEFNNERQRLMEEVAQLASKASVSIAPAVLASFPEFTAETTRPTLLWAQLHFVHQTLLTAIQCRVSNLQALDLPPFPSNIAPGHFQEIPIGLELVGSSAALWNFLQTLPIRGADLKALGLPEVSPAKPPLFLDHLLLRKQNPAIPDEARLILKLTGFCTDLRSD